MVYETIIALRYLGSRKKNHFISVITVISCAGVSIGVWALIVVIAVMAGFEGDLRSKILETYAHLLVDRPRGNFSGYAELVPQLEQLEHVQGASPFLRTEVMISSAINLAGVALKGIDGRHAGVVNRLDSALVEGRLEHLAAPEKIPRPSFSSSGLSRGGSGEPEPVGTPLGAVAVVQPGELARQAPAPDAAEDGAGLMPPLTFDTAGPDRVLPGLLIGAELKKSLLVLVGDEVSIVSPLGDLGPSGPIPRTRTFRVAGVFFTGMYEYDSKMVYATLGETQRFLGIGDEVSGIELRLDEPERTDVVAPRVSALLTRARQNLPELRLRDWKALNSSLFSALLLEKIAMFVILTLVTIVASFNIVASLIMVVLEKKKEVAILKALGTTDRGIARIFMTEGMLIGLVGMVLGVLGGVATCLLISRFGIPLDQDVYYIDRLPVELRALDIGLIALSALLISFLATLYPSRLAARLLPAEGLRHE